MTDAQRALHDLVDKQQIREVALRLLSGAMHHVGNHRVELFGDVAISEAYSTNTHWDTRIATRM
ncbi:hypothetical protein MWU77_18865 [Rhodococcus sp. F64268]|uniref:hypothetical protein n=1 Tax=Rhodococcus sp. F64268 TaxID=2926402 RepID=UPI001FF6B77E|nr:hypothetical protein [Rhodococcus sp. F64268]MCK0092840.1 hypothetical protein [Rhodococcus sp. F64268]